MPDAIFNFPRGFLWGTATSSHQVEGNNVNNNWSAWEQEEDRIIDGHKAGIACDWWGGRWKEDFDRAVEGGQNTHRLSIEWSRVQPAPDRWDEDVLDHYREMMLGLKERDMAPLITLHHFTDPLWLTEMGGWENEAVIELFSAYVSKVVNVLGSFVDTWCTLNEPNVYAVMGYIIGDFPPGKQDLSAAISVMVNQVKAHAAAYQIIHELQPEAQVGMAINWRGFHPQRRWLPFDGWLAGLLDKAYNDFFPEMLMTGKARLITRTINLLEAKETQDYLGINYYSSDTVAVAPLAKEDMFVKRFYPSESDLSPTGFIANIPSDFFQSLKWGLRFNVPIIVTENGTEDSQDDHRQRYMVEHIHQLWRAVNFNYPIKGYYHWSLVDNFEWERGWTQRFGLWELNVETQAREKRPSADLYAAICRQNAISTEVVFQFAPEVFEKMFPG